jgi:hypothetical protein
VPRLNDWQPLETLDTPLDVPPSGTPCEAALFAYDHGVFATLFLQTADKQLRLHFNADELRLLAADVEAALSDLGQARIAQLDL